MVDKTYMILGGGGMIGFQIARRICDHLDPEKLVIVSLYQQEVRTAISNLQKEFPDVAFEGFWGDVFLRSQFNVSDRQQRMRRSDLLKDDERRDALYEDLFGDAEAAYERSQLASLILQHRPDVIVDAINTATAISYQDIYTASALARRELEDFLESTEREGRADPDRMAQALETLLISQYVPQLIRHVIMINRAMRTTGVRLYLKVGTTGTGGLGLNIPYTHGEDRPSATLMSKTAIAFAHTGLLFLMARTVGGPIVKELKPAALVGWVNTTFRTIRRRGEAASLFRGKAEKLEGVLRLRQPEGEFEKLDRLKMTVADTGENGVFAKGELEAITALRQMELITPEEIARAAVLEIEGINTGKDVIPALDSAVMGPTYRGGYLRHQAIEDLNKLEQETGIPSVALGELGPPELSKLLWETYLLKEVYGSLNAVLERTPKELAESNGRAGRLQRRPAELSQALHSHMDQNPLIGDMIVSTGLAILMPDGQSLMRGPFMRIPELAGQTEVVVQPDAVDAWARKGWVDLRPENMGRWLDRIKEMRRARQRLPGRGSAAVDREAYLYDQIYIGEVVGWVFNNEMGGYRIK